MRIRSFCQNIQVNELKPHELKDCDVVVDGQNFFYNTYKKSGLPYEFGCESDKYAKYLRDQLSIFKKANIKCYFIFKGGHNDIQRKVEKYISRNENAFSRFQCEKSDDIVLPIFMKEIYKQVLDEMNFSYVICELESKKQCIALAQKVNCPVISFDIEFCFAGVQYIPVHDDKTASFLYNEVTRAICCGLFIYDDFMKKYNLNKEKLATFIVLTDENIFPENFFHIFFTSINIIKCNNYNRNFFLLRWLSRNLNVSRVKNILQNILKSDEIVNFTSKKKEVTEFICRKEIPGIPVEYLMHDNHIDFDHNDPQWFEKGVACGYVPLQYVNIYRYNTISGSWSIEDTEAEDAMFLSVDIIKYAFNLLTNFQEKELKFHNNKDEVISISAVDATSIPKPPYTAVQSLFENGWSQIKSLRLFEYFLEKSMPDSNFDKFDALPEDIKLLMISLVYFSRQKPVDTTVEVCSVLLSYVMLGVVFDKTNNNGSTKKEFVPKPLIDSITDEEQVTKIDSDAAVDIMSQYFSVRQSELKAIFDRKMIHPLVEFQHCLQQINFLNKLCGSPYKPTLYSRTYNGTFVYKVAHTINVTFSGRAMDFIEDKLCPAPTVLAFFNGLKDSYDDVMYR